MKKSKIKILLADDIPTFIDTITSHLDTIGNDFTYIRASNGRDACKKALRNIPDLIIMDWDMPQMNGIEAMKFLKKNHILKDIPVIFSSGFTGSENVKDAMEAGAIDYIKKPIDSIELIARVKSVLALQNSIKNLKIKQEELNSEREKVEKLLKGLMPAKIVDEIKATGTSRPRSYRCASVMFIDLVGFTKKSTQMSPRRLISELNDLFSSFDHIITINNCIRIKTLGDGYLAVCGLPEVNEDHANLIISAAFDLKEYIQIRNKTNPIKWKIRIGINSGPIIGSLIGFENYLFDVFGATVNAASRIQKNADPMEISCGKNTVNLTRDNYLFSYNGKSELKGLGEVDIFNIIEKRKPIEATTAKVNLDFLFQKY